MAEPDHEVTQLLAKARVGDDIARDRLIELVEPELKKLAAILMRRERRDHSLQATALVNEAYIRLARSDFEDWNDRAHFYRAAASCMRHILVDHARRKKAARRGGHTVRVELDDSIFLEQKDPALLLDLDLALTELARKDDRQAQVVEMSYFAGMTTDQIALVLGVSPRKVKRDWQFARAWLIQRLDAPGRAAGQAS